MKLVELAAQYPKDRLNCGVIAISIAARRPYIEVEQWFRNRHNRSSNWKGITFPSDYVDALRYFGVNFTHQHYVTGKPTLRWLVMTTPPRQTIVADIRKIRHVVTIRSGQVIDQHCIAPIGLRENIAELKVHKTWTIIE